MTIIVEKRDGWNLDLMSLKIFGCLEVVQGLSEATLLQAKGKYWISIVTIKIKYLLFYFNVNC